MFLKKTIATFIFILFVAGCGSGGSEGGANGAGLQSGGISGTQITISLPGAIGGASLIPGISAQGIHGLVIPAKLTVSLTGSSFTLSDLQTLNPSLTFPIAISPVPAGGTNLSLQVPLGVTITISVSGFDASNLQIFSGSTTVDIPSSITSGTASPSANLTITKVNQPPSVSAGTNVTVLAGASVSLSGTITDPNGDSTTAAWTFSSKPTSSIAVLVNPTSTSPSFTADKAGSYVIQLTGSDGLLSASSSVTINALPADMASANFTYQKALIDDGNDSSSSANFIYQTSVSQISSDSVSSASYILKAGFFYRQ